MESFDTIGIYFEDSLFWEYMTEKEQNDLVNELVGYLNMIPEEFMAKE